MNNLNSLSIKKSTQRRRYEIVKTFYVALKNIKKLTNNNFQNPHNKQI